MGKSLTRCSVFPPTEITFSGAGKDILSETSSCVKGSIFVNSTVRGDGRNDSLTTCSVGTGAVTGNV